MTINNNEEQGIELEIKIKSQLQYLSIVRTFLKNISDMKRFSEDVLFEVTLVLDEAVANIIEHGYQLNPDNEVKIKVAVDSEKIFIELTDYSDGFDFESFGNVDLDAHTKRRKNRGLGVYIIKKIMDDVKYERGKDQGNRLLMTKYLKKNGD